jgi:hypothetical protein
VADIAQQFDQAGKCRLIIIDDENMERQHGEAGVAEFAITGVKGKDDAGREC